MGKFAEQDSQLYIENKDGSFQTGGPSDVYATIREAKGFIEFFRGLADKSKRDAEEALRRQQLPPLPAPIPPLPPQGTVSTTVAVEEEPVGLDSPQQQGATEVQTGCVLETPKHRATSFQHRAQSLSLATMVSGRLGGLGRPYHAASCDPGRV